MEPLSPCYKNKDGAAEVPVHGGEFPLGLSRDMRRPSL